MEKTLGREDMPHREVLFPHCLQSWSVTLDRDHPPPSHSGLFTGSLSFSHIALGSEKLLPERKFMVIGPTTTWCFRTGGGSQHRALCAHFSQLGKLRLKDTKRSVSSQGPGH